MKKLILFCLFIVFWLTLLAGCAPPSTLLKRTTLLSVENKFTANLVINRREHTATLLPGGQVLLAGGETYIAELDRFIPLEKCEVFDPQKDMFFTNATLEVARSRHTATLLPSGKVFIAGGRDSTKALFDTEIYSPKQNLSLPGPIMLNARYGHTATLLPNGVVLVANGNSRQKALTAIEEFSFGSNQFKMLGHTHFKGANRTATLLKTGKILFTGGWYREKGVLYFNKGAELYDPLNNYSQLLPELRDARAFHTATLLSNGNVLIVGGKNHTGDLKTVEIFDRQTRRFSLAEPLHEARSFHSAVAVDNQRVLIIGGSSKKRVLKSMELYDVYKKQFSITKPLNTPRRSPSATLLSNNSVLVAGGSFGELVDQVHLTSFSLVAEVISLEIGHSR